MGKVNPYGLFVQDEFKRMQRSGEMTVFENRLYKELGPKWQGLPEQVRDRYKDRAKNGTFPPPKSDLNYQSKHYGPKEDSKTFNRDDLPETKFQASDSNIKPNVEAKPEIGRGVKRECDTGYYDQNSQNEDMKRTRWGFSVPNWRNIRNMDKPDVERYPDYYLLEARNKCESLVSTRERRLLDYPVYTYSSNVLCRYKKDGKFIYVPIEIGIYAYSIKDGTLGKPFHVLIDAGTAPIGYFNDSRDHSINSHKIPFTGHRGYPEMARSDYATIYKEMLKYTRNGERTILVADASDMQQVMGTIEWIYEKAAALDGNLAKSKPSTWTVVPLIEYVVSAYNFVYQRMLHNPKPAFVLHYYLKIRLESGLWDYDTALMCLFHQEEEYQTKWCARNCAMRVIKCVEEKLEEIYRMYQVALANLPHGSTESPRPTSFVDILMAPKEGPPPVVQHFLRQKEPKESNIIASEPFNSEIHSLHPAPRSQLGPAEQMLALPRPPETSEQLDEQQQGEPSFELGQEPCEFTNITDEQGKLIVKEKPPKLIKSLDPRLKCRQQID